MAGMYRLLQRLGMEPVIVSEWTSHKNGFAISALSDCDWNSFDLIIYHHSQYWQLGDYLLGQARCPIIVKYHNITPAHFFQPYFDQYYDVCARGREQTAQFIAADSYLLLTASSFSKEELIQDGANPERVHVVAPFNRTGELLPLHNLANYDSDTIELLFVGRLSPNKGHFHLLRVLSVLVFGFSRRVMLRIVGGIDPALSSYQAHIEKHIAELGLESHVEIRPHCPNDDLVELYRRSHAYLCLSEHEGFNVPVIESQAIGLPIVGAGVTATGETAGPNQLFGRVPASLEDDYFYAGLIEQVFGDAKLRAQLTLDGERNVRERFVDEPVENAFVSATYSSLNGW